nr:MAG TPA: hypothetical protein [Caudoviricetes sp.]
MFAYFWFILLPYIIIHYDYFYCKKKECFFYTLLSKQGINDIIDFDINKTYYYFTP